jgi:HEXXH motif-containing protein
VDSPHPTELTHHRLPAGYFEALAQGAGSPAISRFLWTTELSRRLPLIVALFEHCETPGALGPLPSAAKAWSVLNRARESDRAAVDDLLLHPQVGRAAAYALRRVRGGAESEFPQWTDLGLVQTLALIAAARVGLAWSTSIPARFGTVMLPTLGLARFSSAVVASTVDARTEAGSIRLFADGREVVVGPDPVEDTDTWWHLRQLNVGRVPSLTLWLDDLDPFRELAAPVPPGRLDDAAFDRWRHLVHDAWRLLCEHHADSAAALAEGVVCLVPLPPQRGHDTRSASSGDAFGSVLVSEPPDAESLAAALVREFQHLKLDALTHLRTLADGDDGSLHYAPWRDDPCPLSRFFPGIYAIFGSAQFWRGLTGPDTPLAGYEYLYARVQTVEALRSVRDAPRLTDAGRELLTRLGSVIDTWLDDRSEPEVVRLARLSADWHRTTWRLRHRSVPTHEATRLAKAWLRRWTPEVTSTPPVESAPARRWPQRIPALVRRRLTGTTTPATPDDRLATADFGLVEGDAIAAREAYLKRLAGPPDGSKDEIQAWVGLALALSDAGDGSRAATALLYRPDLVRAVHTMARAMSGRAVDPVEIATWLAPVVKDG